MKRLSSILIMLVAFLMMGHNVMAADTDPLRSEGVDNPDGSQVTVYGDPDPDVYWYFIRMKIDSKKRELEITGGGAKIERGSSKAFSKAVWNGIRRRMVCVGPFHSEAEALNSKIYYKKNKDKINELPQPTAPSSLNWFEVSFNELKRMNSYEFTRSPAAVSSGSANQFVDALYEGLSFMRLSIGPFWDYTQAEEAKAIYRLNE